MKTVETGWRWIQLPEKKYLGHVRVYENGDFEVHMVDPIPNCQDDAVYTMYWCVEKPTIRAAVACIVREIKRERGKWKPSKAVQKHFREGRAERFEIVRRYARGEGLLHVA